MRIFLATFISAFALIAGSGCEKEMLLVPETINSDDYASWTPNTMLVDVDASTVWLGAYYSEYVDYYFSTLVCVTKVYVHNYHYQLDYLYVYVAGQNIGIMRDAPVQSAWTFQVDNIYVDTNSYVRFWFRTESPSYVPHVSAAKVYGCYVTSEPTNFPTRESPTYFPTIRPTILPTLSPANPHPTKTPSFMPTTSPTMIPTTAQPTSYPSLLSAKPSASPTVPPTPFSAPPTLSPTISPTPLSAPPILSPTISPTPLSAQPTISPTISPTVVEEEIDGFSFVLGKSTLFVAGAVLIIFCLGLCSLWLILMLRWSQRQNEVIKILNISEKNKMEKVQTTPNFGGEFYPTEGRVKNTDPGNIQLGAILSVSDEKAMTELETPIIEDEFYFTEVGENDQKRKAHY